ncbi:hypothetical protein AHiyo4_15190 [Arthrobacter sp. Hiyo4]|nr:hypothetical protein AHiyo4_15190 [Arthrobacter sp. Hiyo4]
MKVRVVVHLKVAFAADVEDFLIGRFVPFTTEIYC